MNKKILVVAPDYPYPPNHGGRVDVWKRMLVLKQLGYDLDLLVSVKEMPSPADAMKVSEVAGNIITVRRDGTWRSLAGWLPHQVMDRIGFSKVALTDHYDYVLIEGSPCEMVLKNPSLDADNIVLRVHNNEAHYFRKLASSTKKPVNALYYFLEFLRFSFSEFLLYKKIRHYLFISKDEYVSFLDQYKDKNAIFLPPAIEPPKDLPETAGQRAAGRVLFVGSLFMPNNRDGVLWYLNEVHPALKDVEGYKFVVAGNSKGESLSWLLDHPSFADIEFHDSPPDLSSLYRSASVFVNPMRFGAGMKIKTVEALCQGLPMVSTTTGTEGTGLQDGMHLYCTDDAGLFASRIRGMLTNRAQAETMVAAALDYIRKEFNVAEKLDMFLSGLAQETNKTETMRAAAE